MTYDCSMGKLLSSNTGLAKPSRFRVSFMLPKGHGWTGKDWLTFGTNPKSSVALIGLQQTTYNSNEEINILCHTCTLPQRTLLTYEHKQLTAPYRVPYSQSYDPVTFSFYADRAYKPRVYFDIWQQAAINVASNTVNYYDEFTSNLWIHSIDAAGNSDYNVRLWEAYPINIGTSDLSYSNMNATQTITVTMAYKVWDSTGNFIIDDGTISAPD